ncbi:hypothetical protein MSAN_01741300 [Mycena sanguinolenta]|uniref:Uncharacterized protein n=1 Tax=Mycena sanguinolenta TaxID=230812 RepID=A0A8H7CT84_9AGAR|nr:hypothetical protein MSAN_01741300 [Mycena sanguinolenta]
MGDLKQALDQIRRRVKSSAKPPASTPTDTPTKSGNQAEWTIDDSKFALDLVEQAQNVAEVAPFVKSAASLLQRIIQVLGHHIASGSDLEPESESVEAGAKRKRQTKVKEGAVKRPNKDGEDPYKEALEAKVEMVVIQVGLVVLGVVQL